MIIVRETTKWTNGTPNGIYVLNAERDTMYAYVKPSTNEVVVLSKPQGFVARGRSFVRVTEEMQVNRIRKAMAEKA